jgi:predicted PurR-regulated permease PerM
VDGSDAPTAMRRLRRLGETCLWLLVIGVAVIAAFWAAGRLRVVVLPIGLAVVLCTFLWPPTQALRRRGFPRAAAAATVLGGSLLVIGGLLALLAPQTIDEFGELDVGISGGLDEIQRWLTDGLGLSSGQIDDVVGRAREQLQDSAGILAGGALTGALLLIEAIAALLIALVVLFFFLKDGDEIWDWLCDLFPPHNRDDVRELGSRSWTALAGFLRGQALVAAFDAFFIGLALVILGTPLVLPLVVLTFFGAFIPIVGAFAAGAAAVLVALVFQGFFEALVVLGAIIFVQQLESNVFEPVVVGRSVSVHPVAILLAVAVGLTLGGILGAFVAAPVLAVSSAVLGYLRERADEGRRRGDLEVPSTAPG